MTNHYAFSGPNCTVQHISVECLSSAWHGFGLHEEQNWSMVSSSMLGLRCFDAMAPLKWPGVSFVHVGSDLGHGQVVF